MYVAFLRSINVGKVNKISMDDLIVLFEKLAHKNIKTYLNTGNVIFDSLLSNTIDLESEISKIILEELELEIEVIVRVKEDLESIISKYDLESIDGKNRYITLLKSELDNESKSVLEAEIEKFKKKDDLFSILNTEVNLYIPNGYGKTKLNNKFIEKKSKVYATTRNINTLEKILKLMS